MPGVLPLHWRQRTKLDAGFADVIQNISRLRRLRSTKREHRGTLRAGIHNLQARSSPHLEKTQLEPGLRFRFRDPSGPIGVFSSATTRITRGFSFPLSSRRVLDHTNSQRGGRGDGGLWETRLQVLSIGFNGNRYPEIGSTRDIFDEVIHNVPYNDPYHCPLPSAGAVGAVKAPDEWCGFPHLLVLTHRPHSGGLSRRPDPGLLVTMVQNVVMIQDIVQR